MRYNKSIRKSIMIWVSISMPLALFQFWPFTLVFFILGGIATGIITVITGYGINFFLVLVIEYLLMVAILFAALYVQERRFDKK